MRWRGDRHPAIGESPSEPNLPFERAPATPFEDARRHLRHQFLEREPDDGVIRLGDDHDAGGVQAEPMRDLLNRCEGPLTLVRPFRGHAPIVRIADDPPLDSRKAGPRLGQSFRAPIGEPAPNDERRLLDSR
jgi:hypothetical protein